MKVCGDMILYVVCFSLAALSHLDGGKLGD